MEEEIEKTIIYEIEIEPEDMLLKELPLTLVDLDDNNIEFDDEMLARYKNKANVIIGNKLANEAMLYKLELNKLKDSKCKEIDASTANLILDTVGDEVKQRNMTARATKLTLKETRGTITDEEIAELDYLDGLFTQVETFIADGNALEDSVQAMTTIEEVEAVEVV